MGPLDLEHPARYAGIRVAGRAGQQLVDTAQQLVNPLPAGGRAEEHGMDPAAPGLLGQVSAQPGRRQAGLVADERAQDGVVVLGQGLRERSAVLGVTRRKRNDRRLARAWVADPSHRDDARRQPPGHRVEDPGRIGPSPVDLVDEDQRRDVEPLEGAEEERRLRLDALDGRDDEHGAVEHAEDALDLRDEVRVARGVDEIDREVADEERGDRGPDGDAAFALEVERVGLGGAGVDAADVVDGAGGEEESLGESGLTGVDVGEDSEIERGHGASCRARRC